MTENSMLSLVKSREGFIWMILMIVTSLSWVLGANHNLLSNDFRVEAVLLMVLAFFKIRLVLRYFMEVRHGPLMLRLSCDAWLLFSCLGTIGMITGVFWQK